ncbi:hypothetical protein H2202_005127 [Exophiala xenobiotica]|nr:hypothetical protein H2202_005127 [Exophiala xenobiotica]KAK5205392.1 hypothetical protein LTR41_008846 [Exophiala xenobiotica]KAK5233438.1 hypothetical protein LTR47_005531 [Exophiala xenobiotica]KAK5249457.1 hypothetical protein LTS06_005683 [Exophiala xenobiotica]KAK5314027.1 hypothetical protein LTR93_010557 [Exophiala xenobiotica]
MALQKYHKGKRRRHGSSDNELQIEEISPDDMAYDGDTEVLRPDQYEEAESDFGDDRALRRLWPDTDDELAGRLRRLSCDARTRSPRRQYDGTHGQKRRSKDIDFEQETPPRKRTEIEVSELVDGRTEQRPIKRRKKQTPKPSMAHRVAKKQVTGTWTDTSEKSDDQDAGMESSNSAAADVSSTPALGNGSEDAMDIG